MQVLELTDSHPARQPTGRAVPCHDRMQRLARPCERIEVLGQFSSTPTDESPQTPKRHGSACVLPEPAVAPTCLAVRPHRRPHAVGQAVLEIMTDAPTAAHDAD